MRYRHHPQIAVYEGKDGMSKSVGPGARNGVEGNERI